MNPYITSQTIRSLREQQGMTQAELAERLCVSDKTISKWETGRGYPDITLLEPLSNALKVSLYELFSGNPVSNMNRSANLKRSCFYVCPVCGNVLHAMGNAVISCCGVSLPPQEAEPFDDAHLPVLEPVEDEYFVHFSHEMSKSHYLSFVAWVTDSDLQLIKLYPEGNPEMRIKRRGHGYLYAYCNHHGLMRQRF